MYCFIVSYVIISGIIFGSASAVIPLSYFTDSPESTDETISHYFNLGYKYKEIIAFLSLLHSVSIGYRQLLRRLKKLGLRRKRDINQLDDIIRTIEVELEGSGQLIGYRQLHKRMRDDYGFRIDRESVRVILSHIDPEGVKRRSRNKLKRREYYNKGPNWLIHIDGYDKLKPFGFAIHGAIDGFSRRILWLRVAESNNDPKIIAGYFLNFIKETGGTPTRVRADCGTETVHVAAIQRFQRGDHTDEFSGYKSFLYGASWANQDMRDAGEFCADNVLELQCLRFCFMELIQKELYRAVKHWNTHLIRPSRNTETPDGKPDMMYFMPELKETRDYIQTVDDDDLEISETLCSEPAEFGCPGEFSDVFQMAMDDLHLTSPSTAAEAKELYFLLLDETTEMLA